MQTLVEFIEHIETLEAEKAELSDGIKAIYAEAKGTGFDPKVMRLVIARRKREREDLEEEATILELYESTLQSSS